MRTEVSLSFYGWPPPPTRTTRTRHDELPEDGHADGGPHGPFPARRTVARRRAGPAAVRHPRRADELRHVLLLRSHGPAHVQGEGRHGGGGARALRDGGPAAPAGGAADAKGGHRAAAAAERLRDR